MSTGDGYIIGPSYYYGEYVNLDKSDNAEVYESLLVIDKTIGELFKGLRSLLIDPDVSIVDLEVFYNWYNYMLSKNSKIYDMNDLLYRALSDIVDSTYIEKTFPINRLGVVEITNMDISFPTEVTKPMINKFLDLEYMWLPRNYLTSDFVGIGIDFYTTKNKLIRLVMNDIMKPIINDIRINKLYKDTFMKYSTSYKYDLIYQLLPDVSRYSVNHTRHVNVDVGYIAGMLGHHFTTSSISIKNLKELCDDNNVSDNDIISAVTMWLNIMRLDTTHLGVDYKYSLDYYTLVYIVVRLAYILDYGEIDDVYNIMDNVWVYYIENILDDYDKLCRDKLISDCVSMLYVNEVSDSGFYILDVNSGVDIKYRDINKHINSYIIDRLFELDDDKFSDMVKGYILDDHNGEGVGMVNALIEHTTIDDDSKRVILAEMLMENV